MNRAVINRTNLSMREIFSPSAPPPRSSFRQRAVTDSFAAKGLFSSSKVHSWRFVSIFGCRPPFESFWFWECQRPLAKYKTPRSVDILPVAGLSVSRPVYKRWRKAALRSKKLGPRIEISHVTWYYFPPRSFRRWNFPGGAQYCFTSNSCQSHTAYFEKRNSIYFPGRQPRCLLTCPLLGGRSILSRRIYIAAMSTRRVPFVCWSCTSLAEIHPGFGLLHYTQRVMKAFAMLTFLTLRMRFFFFSSPKTAAPSNI